MIPFQATAAILAGGFGTRLKPVLSAAPKVLAPVAGRPFLFYLLTQLDRAGIRRAVICTGYRAEEVERTFGPAFGALKLVYSAEPAPLGTGGALRRALSLFDTEAILVMNGDSFCGADLAGFCGAHSSAPGEAGMILTRVDDAARYGKVLIDHRRLVTAFLEKGAATAGWINTGIYLISRRLLEEIPPGEKVSIEREVFPGWAARRRLYGWPAPDAPFIDIGTPQAYAEAQSFFGPNGAWGG